ncbi:MAG: maleylpyruvate isomerase family mycothiol-dependent enzyme [Actinomycetota bacterium]|nr:maleylpyruvate isomerase family mycothiol-dependent enzyme [Actinomycetota bacterium]
MQTIVAALTEQHRELDEVLSALAPADWKGASRCPGWTIADVVLHLAQTDELAAASGHGRPAEVAPAWLTAGGDVDARAAESVERDRGASGAAVYERWRAAARSVRTMFAGVDPSRRMLWVVGELPARTLATTRLAEAWIHTGDVLEPLGVKQPATDRLWHIARLAWRTLPYAFARNGSELSGPVALALTAPDGSDWTFGLAPSDPTPATTVRGPALDFCLVAAQRLAAPASALTAQGPDANPVLTLVRTFA